jgi:hypothetical protein
MAGVRATLESVDTLDDIAKRYGISASKFQAASNIAVREGSSLNAMEKAMKALVVRSQQAVNGNERYAASFSKLGVSMDSLRSKDPMGIFLEISDALKGTSADTETLSALSETMGVRQIELITAMQLGSEEILKQGSAMGVWSDDTTASLAKVNETLELTNNQLMVGLGYGLEWVMNAFNTAVAAITLWFRTGFQFWDNLFNVIGRLRGILKDVTSNFGNLGAVIGKLLIGDFDGAKASADKFTNNLKKGLIDAAQAGKTAVRTMTDDASNNLESMRDTYAEIWKSPSSSSAGNGSGPRIEVEDLEKVRELQEEIAKIEEERRAAGQSAGEKIAALMSEEAELAKQVNDSSVEGLEAKKRILEIQQEIVDANEAESEALAQNAKEAENLRAELEDLRAEVGKSETGLKMRDASVEERIAELKKEQARWAQQANDDTLEGLTAKKKVLELEEGIRDLEEKRKEDAQNAIDDITGKIESQMSAPTDSITRIGGGRIGTSNFGGNVLKNLLEQQKQAVKHLSNIEKGVRNSKGTRMKP